MLINILRTMSFWPGEIFFKNFYPLPGVYGSGRSFGANESEKIGSSRPHIELALKLVVWVKKLGPVLY